MLCRYCKFFAYDNWKEIAFDDDKVWWWDGQSSERPNEWLSDLDILQTLAEQSIDNQSIARDPLAPFVESAIILQVYWVNITPFDSVANSGLTHNKEATIATTGDRALNYKLLVLFALSWQHKIAVDKD